MVHFSCQVASLHAGRHNSANVSVWRLQCLVTILWRVRLMFGSHDTARQPGLQTGKHCYWSKPYRGRVTDVVVDPNHEHCQWRLIVVEVHCTV